MRPRTMFVLSTLSILGGCNWIAGQAADDGLTVRTACTAPVCVIGVKVDPTSGQATPPTTYHIAKSNHGPDGHGARVRWQLTGADAGTYTFASNDVIFTDQQFQCPGVEPAQQGEQPGTKFMCINANTTPGNFKYSIIVHRRSDNQPTPINDPIIANDP